MKSLLFSLILFMIAAFVSRSVAEDRILFDIPAQSMPAALESYSSVTGRAVIYDADLVTALRSNAVRGMLLPKEALRLMIEGRGLSIVFGVNNVFALVPGPPPVLSRSEVADGRRPYFALIQRQIEDAFCRDAITRPGGYRIALSFWLGPRGDIERPRLLGSSGSVRRDEAILGLVGEVQVEEPPPPSLPMPVVLVISPKPPELTGDCRQP
jgi:hypothetical protein